jgi:hypothetical protein
MKALLILLTCGSCLFLFHRYPATKEPRTKIAARSFDTVSFKTMVQPIFEKHCSPCHFPGGKMYEKLPFDQGETIINRQAGILRRIKGEDDLRLIKQYVEQNQSDN